MNKIVAPLLLLSMLTACSQRADEPENAASTGAPAATAPGANAAPASTANGAKVTFEPAAFESCTPNKFSVAKVSWDASASGAATVDVKTVAADGSETLFATTGAVGSKETGPWIGPGSVIIVRHHDTGAELGRGVAASKPCGT